MQIDETPIKILKSDKKGYLWSYFSPQIGNGGIIIFDLTLTRSGDNPKKRLAKFKGLIQTDGYSGYQGLRDSKNIEGLGCITHARRKFAEVVKISRNNNGIAAEALEKLKPLYALEDNMREKNIRHA